MSGFKDFWVMTRRERRGAIVVLAAIALLLAITVMSRSCHTDQPIQIQGTALSDFEAEADSSTVSTEKAHKAHKRVHEKKKHHRRPASKPKRTPAAPQPRRIDPVPQFQFWDTLIAQRLVWQWVEILTEI